MIRKESPSEAMARHQPDYDATIDHATSYEPPTSPYWNGSLTTTQAILPCAQARHGWQ